MFRRKIVFSKYDMDDMQRYRGYLGATCSGIPSDLYPHVVMAHRDILDMSRAYEGGVCWHKDNFNSEEYWYMPVGKCEDYLTLFNKYVPKGTQFAAVSEGMKDILKAQLGENIYFEEQKELDDYIIDNRQLTSMEGCGYKGIRSHVNKINREVNPVICDLKDVDILELREFNKKALNRCDRNNIGIIHEEKVSEYLLSMYRRDPFLFGTVVRIDEEVKGFTINEMGFSKECVGIYMKTDHDIKGLGQYLSVMDAKRQLERGIVYCNIMADEGEENLRINKLGLRPVRMIKKYYGQFL